MVVVPVVVGFGGFDGFVGRLVEVVVVVALGVVVVVVVGRDEVWSGRVVRVRVVTGTGTTRSGVVVVVCAGAGCPWKSVVVGIGILMNVMPSTTPAIADTTTAVLALITRSNGVLAARLTGAPSR
ncbi:hypothetical protein BCF44_118168 [Kutzneria buriramensis]|uniref:Uncharacterized protein n=1 Tax=Kutzneria buriramensis TaxID=1045776 RepID=A0A3E0GYQ8_9PSEU|nr:hypothetical protein BCF44_118168 [Kutzneria buriramensis]